MRIQRHDALVNRALAKIHPGLLKEQRAASYDDGLRPGDFFHPNYQHGRLACFDISVAVQFSHLLFPPLLHERLPRIRSIWQLCNSQQ